MEFNDRKQFCFSFPPKLQISCIKNQNLKSMTKLSNSWISIEGLSWTIGPFSFFGSVDVLFLSIFEILKPSKIYPILKFFCKFSIYINAYTSFKISAKFSSYGSIRKMWYLLRISLLTKTTCHKTIVGICLKLTPIFALCPICPPAFEWLQEYWNIIPILP